jgi:maleate cis-trans isomerase
MALQGKKRLGLLVPPTNTCMEDDFAQLLPDSVRLHVNRLYSAPEGASSKNEGLRSMGDHVEESTRLLAKAAVDVIAFGCTSGSFLDGLGYDEMIIQKIEKASGGAKGVATARAVVDALNELGVKKIAACSPYEDDRNERLIRFYTDAGFDIISFDAIKPDAPERRDYRNINNAPPEVAFELAKRVDRPDAEAIFISCTAFRGAVDAVDELERITGKPVVTSNQATFWACLRAMDFDEPVPGAGMLLRGRVAA